MAVDYLQWIDPCAQRLGHTPALGVADNAVNQDVVKGLLPHQVQAAEDHSRDPEEDDVIRGDQHTVGIKVAQVLRVVRPA